MKTVYHDMSENSSEAIYCVSVDQIRTPSANYEDLINLRLATWELIPELSPDDTEIQRSQVIEKKLTPLTQTLSASTITYLSDTVTKVIGIHDIDESSQVLPLTTEDWRTFEQLIATKTALYYVYRYTTA